MSCFPPCLQENLCWSVCFANSDNVNLRTLSLEVPDSLDQSNSPARCTWMCDEGYFQYAGVEMGKQCCTCFKFVSFKWVFPSWPSFKFVATLLQILLRRLMIRIALQLVSGLMSKIRPVVKQMLFFSTSQISIWTLMRWGVPRCAKSQVITQGAMVGRLTVLHQETYPFLAVA